MQPLLFVTCFKFNKSVGRCPIGSPTTAITFGAQLQKSQSLLTLWSTLIEKVNSD